MVSKNRKDILDTIRNIEFILSKHELLQKDFLRLEGEANQQQVI